MPAPPEGSLPAMVSATGGSPPLAQAFTNSRVAARTSGCPQIALITETPAKPERRTAAVSAAFTPPIATHGHGLRAARPLR